MSLVNDMLRDLDRRRQLNNEAISGTALSPAASVDNRFDLMRLIIFGMAALVLSVLAILWLRPELFLPIEKKITVKTIEDFNSDTDTVATTKVSSTTAATSPADVSTDTRTATLIKPGHTDHEPEKEQKDSYQNISVNGEESLNQNTADSEKTFSVNLEELSVKETEHSLRLQFRLDDVVQQEVNRDEHSLSIYLPDTELNSVLPPLADYALINKADIVKRDAGLEITLQLARDFQVQDYVTNLNEQTNVMVELLFKKQAQLAHADNNHKPANNKLLKSDTRHFKTHTITAIQEEGEMDNAIAVNRALTENKTIAESTDDHKQSTAVVLKSSNVSGLKNKDMKMRQQSLRLLKTGRRKEAVEKLQRFIYRNPAAHNSRELLVSLLLADEQIALAESVLMEGISRQPTRGAYRKLLSRVLMQRDQYQQALDLLIKNPPSVNKDSEYHALMAVLYQKQNQHKKTVNVYQQLLQLDNSQGSWWVGMGISYDALGSDEYARNAYRRALQLPKLSKELRQYAMSRLQNRVHIK